METRTVGIFPYAHKDILFLIAGRIQNRKTLVGEVFHFDSFPWHEYPGAKVLSREKAIERVFDLHEEYPRLQIELKTRLQLENALIIKPAITESKHKTGKRGETWDCGFRKDKNPQDRFRMVRLESSSEHEPLGEFPSPPCSRSPSPEQTTILDLQSSASPEPVQYIALSEKWPQNLPRSHSSEKSFSYDNGYDDWLWSLEESLNYE